jgi:hypothetical protein
MVSLDRYRSNRAHDPSPLPTDSPNRAKACTIDPLSCHRSTSLRRSKGAIPMSHRLAIGRRKEQAYE